jgi:4-amino-4-deoxychorismate lyase
LTPALEHGALAGVLRDELLASGEAIEHELSFEDLDAGGLFVGNSARGLIRARLQPDRDIVTRNGAPVATLIP